MNAIRIAFLWCLVLAGCSEPPCPRRYELMDIAVRCHDRVAPDEKACALLKSLPSKCIECRKRQFIEPEESVALGLAGCEGV